MRPATDVSDPLPKFALYGEQSRSDNAEFVHVELIETRSRLHDWHIAAHTHPGLFQVLFLFGGQVRATLERSTLDCAGPIAITVPPSVAHGFDFADEAHGYVLTIDQHVLFSKAKGQADLFAPLFVEPRTIALPDAAARARIGTLLDQLIMETSWPEYAHTLMLDWLAHSVLVLLLRVHARQSAATQSGHRDFELFSRFRTLVEQHYKAGMAVARYAGLLRITPVSLNRLCMRLAEKSAFDIIFDRLMLEACRKLTYAPSSIASIGFELGFQDPAYFSRAFKRRMGMTPKEFRQRGRDNLQVRL